MTILLIALLAAGVLALLERAHRRAGPLDAAPGRLPPPDRDRVEADLVGRVSGRTAAPARGPAPDHHQPRAAH